MAFQKKLSTAGEELRESVATKRDTLKTLNEQLATLTRALEDAKEAKEQAEQGLQLAFENQGDVTEAFRVVKASEDAVRLAEAARAATARKLDEADGRLRDTEQALKREELLALVVKLEDLAKKADTDIARLGSTIKEWRDVAAQVARYGYHELDARMKTSIQLFRVRLLDGCGFGELQTGLTVFVGARRWAEDQVTSDDVVRVTTPQGGKAA
jgi:ABC-type transporter Mla subunit MlaD